MLSSVVAKFGTPTPAATGLLIAGWMLLPAISYDAGYAGKADFSFWGVLRIINASNLMDGLGTVNGGGSAGFYGLLGVIALAGPFLAHIWADKRAALGGALPLMFMLVVAERVEHRIAAVSSALPAGLMDQAGSEIVKGIRVGTGAYLSVLAALYLGFVGIKKFLVAKDVE